VAHPGQERVLHPVELAHAVGDVAGVPGVTTQLELDGGVPGQTAQGPTLGRGQLPRHAVEDTDGADGVRAVEDDRGARVEAELVVADDEQTVREAGIRPGVRHLQHVVVLDRVGAERLVASGLLVVDPDLGLDPLPLGVDQADHADRGAADLRGQQRDVVEVVLRRGVEHPGLAEGGQAALLVGRQKDSHVVMLSPPRGVCDGFAGRSGRCPT
jgi:hypothetical protein